MTKREFENLIFDTMSDLSLEKQEEFLNKVYSIWLPDIMKKFSKKISKKYAKCGHCGKYSFIHEFKTISKKEEFKDVIVHTDAGYGDNDQMADVTYLITYSICPKCNANTEKSRMYLSENNRHYLR